MDIDEIKALSDYEIKAELQKMQGWVYKDQKISKEFSFPTFSDTVTFVNQLAPFCNKVDHHPDIHIFYNKILFELQRFDVGGKVTNKDFMVAHEIERLYGNKERTEL
ncbi:4a-hydroxytetrahydrobiopterin dehydratase [Candidatus Parcubacteria bacterium]|nr:4a-hydroxytetrahydrobiopterin dehydratase [Candidatus Parcubacteria bacterium]